MNNNLSYEEALRKLEKIVSQLEDGNLPLEKAVKLFEEGLKLTKICTCKLEEAEGKIQQLVESSKGNFQLKNFSSGE